MEYRDQVLAYAEAEAAEVLPDDAATAPVVELSRRVHAAVRLQSVLCDWRNRYPDLLDHLIRFEPEGFIWRLVDLGGGEGEGGTPADPYLVEAVGSFIEAEPRDQAEVYLLLREHVPEGPRDIELAIHTAMYPIATRERARFQAAWAEARVLDPA
jgi:hypothetical protein